MRALLTGGAGFIGSHLGQFLEGRGYEVIYLDNLRWSTRTPHNCIVGDVRDKELVNWLVSQSDEIFHLAAQISVDYGNDHPDETVDINVKGTLNLLEACKTFGKRMIYASSSEVYGTAQTDKISEKHPTDAQSIYAASKLAGDRLCKSYADTFQVDVRILRNFNTFGTYQRFDSYGGVIAIFTDRALHGKAPIIFGDGEQERDYIWITDAVRGYELIAEKGIPGQPINIGSGTTITVNEIARLVQKFTGCPDAIHTKARPGEVRRLCADTTLAQSLGFQPVTRFEDNLKTYIDWRKQNEM